MSTRFGARVLVLALSLVFVGGALSVSAPNASASWVFDWDNEMALGAPASQSVVVIGDDGLVYIMGGVTDGTYNAVANSYSYDPDSGAWDALASMPGAERGAAGAVGTDGLIYVFGGASGNGHTQIYDPDADSWSLGDSMLYPMWEGKAATVSNGSIWVVGGEGIAPLGCVQIYDPVGDSWSVGPAAPADVMCGALIADDDDLYYSGGGDGGYTGTTDFYKYDASAGDWISLADLPEARAAHGMVMGVDGLIYLVGGSTNGYNWGGGVTYNSVVAYDPAADEWSTVSSMDYSRTYLGVVVTSDGRILALGGNTPSTILTNVESLQLYVFEYSIEMSATSVRAGGAVLMVLDAQYTYIEAWGSELYWYLISDADGTVYASDGMWISSDASIGVTIEVPVAVPAGDYIVVLDYWYVYADGVYEIIEMEEFALEVLPAAATTEELLAELADLQAQLALLNASQAEQIDALNDAIAALEQQLEALQSDLSDTNDQVGSIEDDSSSASMWSMVNMVLLIVVLVLLALMFVMSRKKPA